jgi:hypothetical protein
MISVRRRWLNLEAVLLIPTEDNMVKLLAIRKLAVGYLCIGFSISAFQNVFGELTAFTWAGSIKGNLLLLFFWFIVPVIHLALGLVLGYFSSALLTDGVSSRSASGV